MSRVTDLVAGADVSYSRECQDAFFRLAGVDVAVENDRWLVLRVAPTVFDRFCWIEGMTRTRVVEEQRDGVWRGERFYEHDGQLRLDRSLVDGVLRLYR